MAILASVLVGVEICTLVLALLHVLVATIIIVVVMAIVIVLRLVSIAILLVITTHRWSIMLLWNEMRRLILVVVWV
jgi:hypothetical protein